MSAATEQRFLSRQTYEVRASAQHKARICYGIKAVGKNNNMQTCRADESGGSCKEHSDGIAIFNSVRRMK